MTTLVKKKRSHAFQKIIAKAMRQKSNMNVKGDMSFAQAQVQRDETLNHLYDILLPICGNTQARQILDTIRLGLRGETIVDCLPLVALGETLSMMRHEVRQAIKKVRSFSTIESVVALDQARANQECENIMAVYWMVQKSYYALYKRFMAAVDRPSINYGGVL